MVSVLCIGIAVLDTIYDLGTPLTPGLKHRARKLAVAAGGNATNAAVAVARLGGKAKLLARLGDDAAGQTIRAQLAQRGVELLDTPIGPGRSTSVSAVLVDEAGERTLANFIDPELVSGRAGLPTALPDGVDAVLGDTRWEEGAAHMLALARTAGRNGVFDADRAPQSAAILQIASHVAFSAPGLAEYTGTDDPRAGLGAVATQTDAFLAVTDGARGVWHQAGDGFAHRAAYPVAAVDTLAAGDVWHGAFALALAEGRDEVAAIDFASAAAALKCTRFGGSDGTPTRQELNSFLTEIRR